MNKIKSVLVVVIICAGLMPALLVADRESEINYLLNFISASGCEFIRNGNHYTAIEAREHIEKKYNYYRSDINTTEDFITYSATRSSLSGKSYEVVCEGAKQTSAQWLLNELKRYRNKMKTGSAD